MDKINKTEMIGFRLTTKQNIAISKLAKEMKLSKSKAIIKLLLDE
jgi:hypothetical protein